MRKNIWLAVFVFGLAVIFAGCDSGYTYIDVAEEERKLTGTWQISDAKNVDTVHGFVATLELRSDKTTNVADGQHDLWYTNGVAFCFLHKDGNITTWYSLYYYSWF